MSCDISSQEDLRSFTEDQNISVDVVKENDIIKSNPIYDEPKNAPKVIRVLTVIGYILAVSLAAIMLSLYYVLMWNPPNNQRNQTSGARITMSCKSALSNSIKSNSDQWLKSPTTTETNIKFAGDEAKDKLYEPKHKKKLVRVLTVVAYVFSVSLAAIMLSLYYIFIWNPNTKVNNKMLVDVNNGKDKCNCHEIISEALKQLKTEDALSLVSPPTYNSDTSSWQSTTEDHSELIYDEASSESKIDDNNVPIDTSVLNYESDSLVSNETQYK